VIVFPAGVALVAAWFVFHDPAFDYRLLVVGSLVPFVFDLAARRVWVGHTLLLAVGVMTVVMLATRRRRAVRRHAIAVPIGMLLALVASAMWTRPKVLWWPAFGWRLAHVALVPSAPVAIGEEIVGLGAIAWFVRRFDLLDANHRRAWLRTGRLPASRVS